MPSVGEDQKIDKYDAVLVKATLGDAISAYLSEKKGFKQNFRLANLKLAVGVVCCLCAVVAQFYPKPFPANYWVLVACAAVYFPLSFFLHYVISYLWEADIVYWADSSELGSIVVRTEMSKGSEFFTFSIGRHADKKYARASKTSSIGEYFYSNGVLVKDALEADVDTVLAQFKANKDNGKKSSSASSSASASTENVKKRS